ncbi:hypothetical protein V2G26_020458 [Clonostachys chloroleuca]
MRPAATMWLHDSASSQTPSQPCQDERTLLTLLPTRCLTDRLDLTPPQLSEAASVSDTEPALLTISLRPGPGAIAYPSRGKANSQRRDLLQKQGIWQHIVLSTTR